LIIVARNVGIFEDYPTGLVQSKAPKLYGMSASGVDQLQTRALDYHSSKENQEKSDIVTNQHSLLDQQPPFPSGDTRNRILRYIVNTSHFHFDGAGLETMIRNSTR
jgi:hypothetical protein